MAHSKPRKITRMEAMSISSKILVTAEAQRLEQAPQINQDDLAREMVQAVVNLLSHDPWKLADMISEEIDRDTLEILSAYAESNR